MAITTITPESSSDSEHSAIQEKNHVAQVEDLHNAERGPTYDEKATKRLLRKIDVRLIPFLALLYLLSFLDRTNIGNARLAGRLRALAAGLTSYYSTTNSVSISLFLDSLHIFVSFNT